MGELVGAPFSDLGEEGEALRAARQDAQLMSEQMRKAWLDLLEAAQAGRDHLQTTDQGRLYPAIPFSYHLRKQDQTVGVVSVDPSSPFSQGAVLGDRIRLADHFLDPGVFIRSMSTRGYLGGVSEATLQALLLLDASGKDVLLLETVGVGQSEVEVASIADTVVLVLMPGSGDSIQALKAGVMEIPDVIVINKADHPAARTMRSEIRSILSLDRDRPWKPPIVETEAIRGEGVDQLWAAVLEHRAFLERDGGLEQRRRRSIEHEVVAVAVAQARRRLSQAVEGDAEVRRLLDRVHARELDPLTATREIAERVLKLGG